ncbi:MAG: putative phospholipid ABC transporter permease protein MlaE [Verrucomicrobia bacterium ADurb.Bin345]|nr:MAG: putative phospholipid ABC transporter permease protein MlaE [Verrucomicrobia bacterium ADurb.Bin345]
MSNWLGRLGAATLGKLRVHGDTAAVVWETFRVALRRETWPRTVRNVFVRQVLFTGYEASRFISLLAVMVGISVVVQMQVWLARVGQTGLLGPVLVMVIVRELGPLLVNFIVLGRSGTAVATELGNMKIAGEVNVLDSQGLDPFIYLVVPRVLGMAISVFCLTIIFVIVSFLSGYLIGLLLGANPGPFVLFVESVFRAVRPADVASVLVKTFVPGALTGAICCMEGLSVSTSMTEVPQVTTRAVVRSVGALFVVSAVMSILTYA